MYKDLKITLKETIHTTNPLYEGYFKGLHVTTPKTSKNPKKNNN